MQQLGNYCSDRLHRLGLPSVMCASTDAKTKGKAWASGSPELGPRLLQVTKGPAPSSLLICHRLYGTGVPQSQDGLCAIFIQAGRTRDRRRDKDRMYIQRYTLSLFSFNKYSWKCHPASLYFIGQKYVPWPQTAAKETGKMSVLS